MFHDLQVDSSRSCGLPFWQVLRREAANKMAVIYAVCMMALICLVLHFASAHCGRDTDCPALPLHRPFAQLMRPRNMHSCAFFPH